MKYRQNKAAKKNLKKKAQGKIVHIPYQCWKGEERQKDTILRVFLIMICITVKLQPRGVSQSRAIRDE